jgi:NDP-sugar pyrophosphorylase family protein
MIDNNIQLIIPMSGIGKRFIDAVYDTPKPLIKVDGFPIIQHIVNLFSNTDDITFICNENHIKETNMWETLNTISPKSKIISISRENLRGPVDAVSKIFNDIDDEREVIISYCDYGTYWDYHAFLKDCRERKADGAIACYKGFHPHMLGSDNYAFLKETECGSRWMQAIQEKMPFTNNKMAEYASNGTYYFKSGQIMKKYFKLLIERKLKVKNEYYVSMVYNLMVEFGLTVSIFEIENMLQWGTPHDLEIYAGWSKYFNNIVKSQEFIKDSRDTTLILPMAGAGSRFSVKGYPKPKPLLDVCGLPMIVQAVNCLPDTTRKVFICLNDHTEKYDVKNTLLNKYDSCDVIGIDGVTEGQACTTEIGIKECLPKLDGSILISACDNGVYYNKQKYQEILDDPSIDIIVWTFTNNPASRNNPNMYAWLQTDANDNIINVLIL